jgi:hypothetical protein
MGQHRFLAYHPHLTFSDPDADRFVSPNGKPDKELDEDANALFGIGRKIYQMFEGITSAAQLDAALTEYAEFIDAGRRLIPEMLASGKLVLKGEPSGQKDVDWTAIEDDSVIGIAWQVFEKTKLKNEDFDNNYFIMVMAIHALIEIDNALISLKLRESGAVVAACEAANALSNLLALDSGDQKLQEARRDLAYRGAIARIERDPKQKEKTFIHECWQRWQQSPETYASKAAFARDMLSKCEHLTSQKKIEDWCREWESETGTQPAQ